MASLMGVAFMLSSLGTLSAESSGKPNNQDKICYYKHKCSTCEEGECENDPDPINKRETYKVSNGDECPTDPVRAGLDDAYEFEKEEIVPKTRSLRSGARTVQPVKLAGGFSPDFVNPKNLKIFGDGAEVVRDADTHVRQIKGDTGFMDAVYTAENKTLELRFYKPGDIKSGKVNGVYQIKEGITPLHVIRYIQEEDNMYREERINNSADSPSVRSHKVTQIVGPEPYTVTHIKTYLKGEGLSAVEYRRASNKITAIPNGEPQEEKFLCTVEELGTDGQWHVTERKAGKRATYREEDGAVLLYECNAVNEDGTPMKPIASETTYTYYSDPLVPASYGKVRTLRSNDGYWENRYYDANTSAGLEMTRTESPWMNAAAHEPGEAPQGQIRIKNETRCATDTGIEDITETVGGITIAKEWTEKSRVDQQKVRLVRHQPHAGGDKITTTVRYRNAKDIPVHLRAKTVSIHNADGSMSQYSYEMSEQDLTITLDQGSGDGNSVTHGKRTVRTQDKDNGKLKEEVRYALEGGQAYWLGSQSGVQFNNAGACLKWVYNNNPDLYTERRKDCCHVTWERDQDNVETAYTYDVQGRVITKTAKGITQTTEYNGLTTIRWKQAAGSNQRYLEKEETRDLAGNIVMVKLPVTGGHVLATNYTFDVENRSNGLVTPYGTSQSTVYAADGQRIRETGSTGITVNYMCTPLSEAGGGLSTTVNDGRGNVTTKKDMAGKVISSQQVNGAITRNTYDTAGRVVKTVLPDGEVHLTAYEKNGTVIQGTDRDGDGEMNPSIDTLTRTYTVFDSSWPENKGAWKKVQEDNLLGEWIVSNEQWDTDDMTQSRNRAADVNGYLTTCSPPFSERGDSYQVISTFPTGWKSIVTYTLNQGVMTGIDMTLQNAQGQPISSSSSTMNVWGHTLTETDSRKGTTQYTVDEATGAILSMSTPENLTTSYGYDEYGRSVLVTLPNGAEQHTAYDAENQITRQWGTGMYPVSYEYDRYGAKIGMRTYRVPVTDTATWPEGADGELTSWLYDETARIIQKKYADNTQESYTYTPGGKMRTATNARGNTCTYSYDHTGKLLSCSWDDQGKTPVQSYTYNQRGKCTGAVTEGVVSYQYLYDQQGRLVKENIVLTTPNGELVRDIIRSYDSLGRPVGYQLKQGETVEQELVYSYDDKGQVSGITADGKQFSYEWTPNALNLLQKMTGPLHTVTNTWESHRDILDQKANSWKNKDGNADISRYVYAVNTLGKRTSVTSSGEAFASTPSNWQWGYDVLGQVTTANEDIYAYDQIGNRLSWKQGNNDPLAYQTNPVNQYTGIGSTIRPTYDLDGNLLTGLEKSHDIEARNQFVLSYNSNNRLIQVSNNGEHQASYGYDNKGRRVHKENTVMIYDGYNAIAEYSYSRRTLEHTYAWGPDMSSSLEQRAGGVGGLLSDTDYTGQLPVVSYPLYDGNGNVTEYLTEENGGSISAHYEYDVFGNILKKTAGRHYSYQFSTKPYDDETGLIYYNYRHYDPIAGRWVARDSIGESGGNNLYVFLQNAGISGIDYLGNRFSRYSEDINSLPYPPLQSGHAGKNNNCVMPARSDGVTCPSAPMSGMNFVTLENEVDGVEVYSTTSVLDTPDGAIQIDLYYNPDRQTPNTDRFRIAEAHERIHAAIIKEEWNIAVEKIMFDQGRNYCKKDCSITMAKIIHNVMISAIYNFNIRNLNFDIYEYGRLDPYLFWELNQKRNDSEMKRIKLTKEINKLIDEYNEKNALPIRGHFKNWKPMSIFIRRINLCLLCIFLGCLVSCEKEGGHGETDFSRLRHVRSEEFVPHYGKVELLPDSKEAQLELIECLKEADRENLLNDLLDSIDPQKRLTFYVVQTPKAGMQIWLGDNQAEQDYENHVDLMNHCFVLIGGYYQLRNGSDKRESFFPWLKTSFKKAGTKSSDKMTLNETFSYVFPYLLPDKIDCITIHEQGKQKESLVYCLKKRKEFDFNKKICEYNYSISFEKEDRLLIKSYKRNMSVYLDIPIIKSEREIESYSGYSDIECNNYSFFEMALPLSMPCVD